MNKSEKLLSIFSEDYFFKELVFDNLKFTPSGATEIELADLIINLGDIIIAIQLKERNEKDQTHDIKKETKWLEKRCKDAKAQIKETIKYLSSGELPAFQNKCGQNINFRTNAKIIPVIVFDNSFISSSYSHILRKHSEEGININCMSFEDYQKMCRVLVSPIEIIDYLKYRQNLLEQHGDIDIMTYIGPDDELIITKPTQNETLVYQFLAEMYGIENAGKHDPSLQMLRNFLHLLPDHTTDSSVENGSYSILLFLAHMSRIEVVEFWDRLEKTKKDARKRKAGILYSLRRHDGSYAILFVANRIYEMEELITIVRQKDNVKQILEVILYWETKTQYRINFLYRDMQA